MRSTIPGIFCCAASLFAWSVWVPAEAGPGYPGYPYGVYPRYEAYPGYGKPVPTTGPAYPYPYSSHRGYYPMPPAYGYRPAGRDTGYPYPGAAAPPSPTTEQQAQGVQEQAKLDQPSAADTEVSISGMRFEPVQLRISAGRPVTWKQGDRVPHTVTGSDGFDSGQLVPGASFSRAFDTPGIYP